MQYTDAEMKNLLDKYYRDEFLTEEVKEEISEVFNECVSQAAEKLTERNKQAMIEQAEEEIQESFFKELKNYKINFLKEMKAVSYLNQVRDRIRSLEEKNDRLEKILTESTKKPVRSWVQIVKGER